MAHVSALCRSGFFQLRQLRPFVQSLTTEAAKTLVQAFISCRLDLLQLASVWSDREHHEESPVAAECRSTPHHRS